MTQEKRVALVIGNSHYGIGPAVSGVEDAKAMVTCLRELEFDVPEPILDATLEVMTSALGEFAARIPGASVVLFYYAGHGFRLERSNFLLPTDGDITPDLSVPVDQVLQVLGTAPGAKKFVFLDACRDEKRVSRKGLADPGPAPPGVLQAFAASPGQLAASGSDDELSLYTMAVLRHLREPGLELVDLFDRIRADVVRDSPRGQQPIIAGEIPTGFFFRPPVEVQIETFGWPHSRVLAFLDTKEGNLVLSEIEASLTKLPLKARNNRLVLMVSHGRDRHNDQVWGRTEGWSYKLDLRIPVKDVPEGQTVTFEDDEPVPFANGPHHGQTFIVGRANLFVDPQTAKVEVQDMEDKVARREDATPFWAQDQEILFQAKLMDLQLSAAELLGGSLDFSLAPLVLPFLDEFLKTGKVLDTVVGDSDKSYVAVRGNKALREVAQHCMTVEWPDRVRDLRDSFTAFFNGNTRPFDVFAERLDASVRANASNFGITLNPEDLRVWTSLDDLSAQPTATSALASPAAGAGEEALALAQESILLPQPGEALVDNRVVEQIVEGVPLRAQVYTFLSVKPVGAKVQLHARVIADLSDLQNKIGPLIDTIPLPTDNCARFAADNIVARIWGKQITVDGNTATLKLNGNVEVWTCLDLPFGLPHFKNRNLSQSFEAKLPIRVEKVDDQSFAVRPGDPDIELGGPLGDFAEKILGFLGLDVDKKAKEILDRAIHPDTLKQKLPDFVLKYNPTLTRAELLSNSGNLALRLDVDTTLNIWQLADLIRELLASRSR